MINSKAAATPVISIIILAIILFSACTDGSRSPNTTQSQSRPTVTEEPDVNPDLPFSGKGIGKFTQVDTGTIDKAMAKTGEAVFKQKCVSCHTATTEKLIGPGLKGMTKIRTPEWIMNMTYNPEEMTRKDPLAKALKKQYKLMMMTPGGVTDEECRQILEFLRLNDSN